MLTTAKSLQLTDKNGINISPLTDLTSLYYEVERDYGDSSIIARKYLYSDFPVAVYIDPIYETGENIIVKDNLDIYKNESQTKDYKVVDNDWNDIIISNMTTDILPGTTYRRINVKKYNLTKILTHYTTREYSDTSINAINASLNALDESIRDLWYLYNVVSKDSFLNFLALAKTYSLIPNALYEIDDYYYGGCMDAPSGFTGIDYANKVSLLLKASKNNSFDGKIYAMYNNAGAQINGVHGHFVINNDKIRITYLKDCYNNEANYDFYNLKLSNYFTFTDTNGNNALLGLLGNTDKICNNIIKIDPYSSTEQNKYMFISKIDLDVASTKIKNNYIGANNYINFTGTGKIILSENVIGNNNKIEATSSNFSLTNGVIGNNNTITINSIYAISYSTAYIGNNNTITEKSTEARTISNLYINSNNYITLTGSTVSNVTIMNDCNTSIRLTANNTFIDGCTKTSVELSANSTYLYGKDLYINSINILN